jgi:hypothetical protein
LEDFEDDSAKIPSPKGSPRVVGSVMIESSVESVVSEGVVFENKEQLDSTSLSDSKLKLMDPSAYH